MTDLPTFTEQYQQHPDRAAWPDGPWTAEPDKVVWRDETTGLDCMVVRGPIGALCGYVGVKADHPWHRKGYSEHIGPDDCAEYADGFGWCYEHSPDGLVNVHGGLTFSDACHEDGDRATSICHLADDGQPVWWFGFDCAHVGDLHPYDQKYHRPHVRSLTYRDLPYVVAEVRGLAAQLAEVAR